ncbi:hypothetical protein WJX82_008913 [Trebouxia sp. C0006]
MMSAIECNSTSYAARSSETCLSNLWSRPPTWRWGETAMTASVAPLHCSNQGSSLPAFESWKDYYMFRTWSLSDPTAIILDAPMTLLWAWQQLPIWLAASSSKHLHDINIHYLGAQKELDQWPEFRRPDLVFGANAGLAAYPSWVPTLQLLSHRSAPASIFTDFCEEAAFQGMRVMQAVAQGPMQWMPVAVNPFRKPLSCQGRDNNLPSYSNAFIFGMAPVADEHE